MKTFIETFPEFDKFNESCKLLVSQVFAAVPALQQFVRIEPNIDLAQDPRFKDKLLVVKEGSLTYRRHDRRVFTFEQGDLIGIERLYFPSPVVEISSSFAVSVDIFSAHDVVSHLQQDLPTLAYWIDYLTLRTSMFTSIMAASYESNMRHVQPLEQIFEPGSVIISEGTEGDQVFCLLKGSAEVFSNGIQVGAVKEDELFGVIAAVTGEKRTATVKAATRCHVAAIRKEDLEALIRSKPSTVARIVESLARVIKELNLQVGKDDDRTAAGSADFSTIGG